MQKKKPRPEAKLLTLTVGALIVHCGNCQIFPFSNLRAFFDPKIKQAKDNDEDANFTRPYRQTNHGAKLPDLHEFDSPEIFTINRDVDNHRNYPVKRHPEEVTQPPPRRRGNGGRNRVRGRQPDQQTTEVDSSSTVFITPNPNTNIKQEGRDDGTEYSKIRAKGRIRIRKPQKQSALEGVEKSLQPIDVEKLQITNEGRVAHLSSESSSSSEVPTFVESVPALGVSIRQDQYDPSDGLVDYLVPPLHPSVYERTIKAHKLTHPTVAPTVLSKKDSRFRVKKHRNHIKSTSLPAPEVVKTNPKRQVGRRRPATPHRAPPVRNTPHVTRPSSQQVTQPSRQQELQQQAAQMDEQIAAETGFTGAEHHPSHHGDERVEFQMHGQKGPHSYKFGYDTGKGHNRQFRYEEKDNHGRVKGHYGYYDKDGKLQVVNYEADSEHGFRADST